MPASRRDIVLAVLAAAQGAKLSPTQLQKSLFLIAKNMPEAFDSGSRFDFAPYNYGPFDAGVYSEVEVLRTETLAEIVNSANGRWKEYSASQAGITKGLTVLNSLVPRQRDYVQGVVNWVRDLSFQQLVKAIYEHYPDMRVNSIFKG